ncbi:chorismate synthase [Ornithinimicrobium cryptoxanthini]|uniref:chorismate synthase n=1 Tax=Ornithinimicrobium cryptoxanthini TaxID=2934161 RepID=UPI002117A361|nr:chorismate synthase [Ornithinimicrobium cryptoxanthini]
MLRWLTAGESHGPALTAMLEGLPAGVRVDRTAVEAALARRRLGYGRGARMSFEADQLSFLSGMRHGQTLGSPIALQIANSEWAKWAAVMNPEPVEAGDLERASDIGAPQEIARNKALTRPRPGHADLVGMQKYGFTEARPVLERASARETAARVALGAVAAAFLEQAAGIRLVSHTVAVGSVPGEERAQDAPDADTLPHPDDVARIDADPVRTLDADLSVAIVAEIDAAKKDGDTLGGVVEVLAWGLPPGLGSYTHWDRRLDSRLAGALMGIQAIKGVEIGEGFRTAARRGSQAHDEIARGSDGQVRRTTQRSGGTEGGMSTGEVLRVRAAMKPISTVPRALQTIDVSTGEAATAIHQRSDVCAVPAAGVVAEAMVALVLADAVIEKFGGDSVAEVRRNLAGYLAAIPEGMVTGSGTGDLGTGDTGAGDSGAGDSGAGQESE